MRNLAKEQVTNLVTLLLFFYVALGIGLLRFLKGDTTKLQIDARNIEGHALAVLRSNLQRASLVFYILTVATAMLAYKTDEASLIAVTGTAVLCMFVIKYVFKFLIHYFDTMYLHDRELLRIRKRERLERLRNRRDS